MIKQKLALAAIMGFFMVVPSAFAAEESPRPNFLFILGEGHGWSSTSVPMDDLIPASRSDHVQTPNLEKLASAGMRFANFYAPSPRCTPSRVAFLTGKSPAQLHMTFINEGKNDSGGNAAGKVIAPQASMELPSTETTLPEMLKHAGYATAHFGKWHMGRASPGLHGFEENDGPNGNGGPDNVANPHPKQLFAMTERGMDFMARQVSAGRPFYLEISHYASRQGGDATAQAVEVIRKRGGNLNERQAAEAAADWDLDVALGRLLEKMNELGIASNTYVIFTTDHGTPGRNPPLAGGKGTVSEGGLRVPFVIRGPGIKAGTCSYVRTVGVDMFPTILELGRVNEAMPKGLEGGSFASLLTREGKGTIQRPREEYVIHFPHYDKDAIGPASAVYLGEYKLIRVYETGVCKLYNIVKDPGERRDLAGDMPEMVRQLDQQLSAYLVAVHAQMPGTNANQDASRPVEPRRGGGRKAKP